MTFEEKLDIATHVRIVQIGTVKASEYHVIAIDLKAKAIWLQDIGFKGATGAYPVSFAGVDKPWVQLLWRSSGNNDV